MKRKLLRSYAAALMILILTAFNVAAVISPAGFGVSLAYAETTEGESGSSGDSGSSGGDSGSSDSGSGSGSGDSSGSGSGSGGGSDSGSGSGSGDSSGSDSGSGDSSGSGDGSGSDSGSGSGSDSGSDSGSGSGSGSGDDSGTGSGSGSGDDSGSGSGSGSGDDSGSGSGSGSADDSGSGSGSGSGDDSGSGSGSGDDSGSDDGFGSGDGSGSGSGDDSGSDDGFVPPDTDNDRPSYDGGDGFVSPDTGDDGPSSGGSGDGNVPGPSVPGTTPEPDMSTPEPEATTKPTSKPKPKPTPAIVYNSVPDYSDPMDWVYCDTWDTTKAADVFFVCPTAYNGNARNLNMPLARGGARGGFARSVRIHRGMYNDNCRFFAPYYRQMSLYTYNFPEQKREVRLEMAYQDVKAAFLYYLENWNDGRPIIIAGFSQGSDMCLRLIKDVFADEALQEQLIAVYAIGWRVTQADLDKYPHLKMAQGETDTGVIISFNTEAESVTSSIVIPEGMKTLSINPLNWTTDSTPAGKELNLGACFPNSSGSVTREIPQLTGAYIDPVRGALKVPDIDPNQYRPANKLFEKGVYHNYDYKFFYRNIEANVQARIDAYYSANPELQVDDTQPICVDQKIDAESSGS